MIHINFRFKKYIIKYIKKYILSLIIFCLIIISILIERKFCHNYKIVAISYANEKFLKQLKINKLTAINIGKVDEYYSYNFDDIDLIFKKQNEDILSRKRGNGYWLWKPYFILKTFKERLNIGDYLIYTDSGIFYLDKAKKLINFMISINEDMWSFKLKVLEKSFSKRDAFILLNAESPIYTDTFQYMAGIQIYKKSKFTENFIEKLLKYSTDKRIITDDPNSQGLPNYNEFIDNRHDQTVLSILTKKVRFSNLIKNKTKPSDINNIQYNLMPKIFCIYRSLYFKSYYELRNKCNEIV
jgi:hypothetical protein